MPSLSRSSIRRSKIASHSLLRAKLSSVMKNLLNALRPVEPHELLDVVGRAEARLAALHVDDRAERALVGAAAAGIEAGAEAERARDISLRQERHRRALHARQVLHEIVDRCELARGRVAQHHVEPALGLAGKHGDAHVPAGVEIDRAPVQHRQAARDVEAAHGDRDAGLAERPRDVEGARILVRLDADQRDKPEIAVPPKAGEQRRHVDAGVGLVDRLDVDGDVRPKDLPLGAVGRDAVDGGERIRRNHRAPPADHIAVVVVVRRLDQDELEAPFRGQGGLQHRLSPASTPQQPTMISLVLAIIAMLPAAQGRFFRSSMCSASSNALRVVVRTFPCEPMASKYAATARSSGASRIWTKSYGPKVM